MYTYVKIHRSRRMNKIICYFFSTSGPYTYVNKPGGVWTQMFSVTNGYLYVRFKHDLDRCLVWLTFEARTEISVGGQESSCPNAFCFVHMNISARRTNKIRNGFIHPPGTAQF